MNSRNEYEKWCWGELVDMTTGYSPNAEEQQAICRAARMGKATQFANGRIKYERSAAFEVAVHPAE